MKGMPLFVHALADADCRVVPDIVPRYTYADALLLMAAFVAQNIPTMIVFAPTTWQYAEEKVRLGL
jgi:hypothetical protein